jgi:hypothetical protein
MRALSARSEEEMVACFLRAVQREVRRAIRSDLAACGLSEGLLTRLDLCDAEANAARCALLAATRGYGENRDLSEGFPAGVAWTRAVLTAVEVATVRYMD